MGSTQPMGSGLVFCLPSAWLARCGSGASQGIGPCLCLSFGGGSWSSNRLPTLTEASELAEAGFLLTYGADTTEIFRLGANQVDRILKRVKPGDLPIAQSTKFELVVNARTAKALAVDVPGSIMLRATKVIR